METQALLDALIKEMDLTKLVKYGDSLRNNDETKHQIPQVLIDEQQWSSFSHELKLESDRGSAVLSAIWIEELLTRKFKNLFSKGNSDARKTLYNFNGPFSSFSSKITAAYCLGWLEQDTYHDINLVRKIRNTFAHHLHGISLECAEITTLINRFKTPKKYYSDWGRLNVVANSETGGVIINNTREAPTETGKELDFQRLRYTIILSLLICEVGANLGIGIRRNSVKADSLFYKDIQEFAFSVKKNGGHLHPFFHKFLSDAGADLLGGSKSIEVPEEKHQDCSNIMFDYALCREDGYFGYVKLITPGNGADHNYFKDPELAQFKHLSAIPNLILYTDGNEWALYRSGQRVSDIVKLSGDIKKHGKRAVTESDAQSLGSLLYDFFLFEPIVPTDHKGKILI